MTLRYITAALAVLSSIVVSGYATKVFMADPLEWKKTLLILQKKFRDAQSAALYVVHNRQSTAIYLIVIWILGVSFLAVSLPFFQILSFLLFLAILAVRAHSYLAVLRDTVPNMNPEIAQFASVGDAALWDETRLLIIHTPVRKVTIFSVTLVVVFAVDRVSGGPFAILPAVGNTLLLALLAKYVVLDVLLVIDDLTLLVAGALVQTRLVVWFFFQLAWYTYPFLVIVVTPELTRDSGGALVWDWPFWGSLLEGYR